MEQRQKLILRLLETGKPVSLFALEESIGASPEELLEELRDIASRGYDNGYELTADDDGYRLIRHGPGVTENPETGQDKPGRQEELAAKILLQVLMHGTSVSLKKLAEAIPLNDVELRFLVPLLIRTAGLCNVKALLRKRTLALQGKEQDLRILAASLLQQFPISSLSLTIPAARRQYLADQADRLLQLHGISAGKAQRTCLHAFLTADLLRIHQGFHINACPLIPPSGPLVSLTEDLCRIVAKETGLTLAPAEKTFFALRLHALAETVPFDQALHDAALDALAAMDEVYGFHLSEDRVLRKELDAWMPSFGLRIRLGCIPLRPYGHTVSESFPLAFELAELMGTRTASLLKRPVPQAEQAALALIFQKALLRRKPRRRLNVLLVHEGTPGEAALAVMQLKARFQPYLHELFVCDDIAFASRRPKLYDLVIASCEMAHEEDIPWFTVGPYLSEEDLAALQHFFERIP